MVWTSHQLSRWALHNQCALFFYLLTFWYTYFDYFLSCLHLHIHIPQDPGTGVGKLMCTSRGSFWEVSLQLDALSNWEITSATKLATAPAYPGGFSFIPSGSYKNNIFFSDWEYGKVKMMKFDTNGLPVVPTDSVDFYPVKKPWGFFFDPQVSCCSLKQCSLQVQGLSVQHFLTLTNFLLLLHLQTNDFFVSTWGRSVTDGIVQFKGFPPGLNVEVVIANIQNEMQVALTFLLNSRRNRKLKADQQPTLDVKNNNRALQTKAAKTKSAKGKTGPVEVEIPGSGESKSYISLPSAFSLLTSVPSYNYNECFHLQPTLCMYSCRWHSQFWQSKWSCRTIH